MKRSLFAILAACLLLTACGSGAVSEPQDTAVEENEAAEVSESSGFVPAPVTAVAKEQENKEETDSKGRQSVNDMPRDPPYDYNIDEMVPSDFGEYFLSVYNSSVETYPLLKGSYFENEVTVIRGETDGPSVYVIAGIHGDEEAAWRTGNLLKKISIKAGTLYILSPANRWGASAEVKTRSLDGKDANRAFPGNAQGNNAQRVAYSIFNDVKSKKPDFVFDLHEATVVEEGRDYLGSSLIFTDITLMEDMFFELLWATQDGTICSQPFDMWSPGPEGSINNTISTQLKIPVITVETFRGYQMEQRIADQLDIIQWVLHYYKMV